MKRLYSIIGIAKGRINVAAWGVGCLAVSDAEAYGIGMQRILAVHPVKDGWSEHGIQVIPIDDDMVRIAAAALPPVAAPAPSTLPAAPTEEPRP